MAAQQHATRPPEPAPRARPARPAGGHPLPERLRVTMESAFGADFSSVGVEVGARPRALGADALTAGERIGFAPGRYAPTAPAGQRLIAHELAHVVQQRAGRVPATHTREGSSLNLDPELEAEADGLAARALAGATPPPLAAGGAARGAIQLHSAADPRLPADEPEALTFATSAHTEIQAAVGRLGASSSESERNVAETISTQSLELYPLTPRHDSTPLAAQINFFPGFNDYTGSVLLPDTVTHWVTGTALRSVYVRAREHADVDNPLPGTEVQRRVVQAVGETAEARAGAHGGITRWDLYRGRFDGWWSVAPYNGMDTAPDTGISTSRGPRSQRSRAIFDRIYAEDSAFAAAYEANTGGLRERVDLYMGPDARNPESSPRVQALREAFYPSAVPCSSTTQYNQLLARLQTVSATLTSRDRDFLTASNTWRAVIASHGRTQPERAELLNAIITPPASGGTTTPTPTATPATPTAPVSGGVTAQQFLDSARIDGPASPLHETTRRSSVVFTPTSPHANPNVAVDSRITLTPAAQVDGSNASTPTRWPNGATDGDPFVVDIRNNGNVTMTATLDLLNEPSGLRPATPATRTLDIVDDRQADFIANWRPTVIFVEPGGLRRVNPTTAAAATVTYRSGAQAFRVQPELTGGRTNPGLNLSARARVIRRGAGEIVAPQTESWPVDQDRTAVIHTPVSAPATIPAGGDPLDFEVVLLSGTTTLSTQTLSLNVLPEVTFTQAQAEAEARADQAFVRGTSSSELMGMMAALPGMMANFADAVANRAVTLDVATPRHDAASYVQQEIGRADPSKTAFFEGTTYGPYPDANTSVSRPSVAAYSLPGRVWLNVTTDVPTRAKRGASDLMDTAVHEGVHALDPRNTPYAFTPAERYRREFRAYWMGGTFGPPENTLCTGSPSGCLSADYDPSMPPPGPKSPRARAIFEHMYTAYEYVKPAYDANTDGFRDMVDSYYYPDGVNLMLSARLNALFQHMRPGPAGNITAYRRVIQQYTGATAPAPALGVLSADEQTYIHTNRAWRDLVERVVPSGHRRDVKNDLGIL